MDKPELAESHDMMEVEMGKDMTSTEKLSPEQLCIPSSVYTAHCIKCTCTNNLHLLPHRKDGKMVGWVFCCPACAPLVYNAGVTTEFTQR